MRRQALWLSLIAAFLVTCSGMKDSPTYMPVANKEKSVSTPYTINSVYIEGTKVDVYKNHMTHKIVKEIYYTYSNSSNQILSESRECDYTNNTEITTNYDAQGKIIQQFVVDRNKNQSATKKFDENGTLDALIVDVGNDDDIDLILDSSEGTYTKQEDIKNYLAKF